MKNIFDFWGDDGNQEEPYNPLTGHCQRVYFVRKSVFCKHFSWTSKVRSQKGSKEETEPLERSRNDSFSPNR